VLAFDAGEDEAGKGKRDSRIGRPWTGLMMIDIEALGGDEGLQGWFKGCHLDWYRLWTSPRVCCTREDGNLKLNHHMQSRPFARCCDIIDPTDLFTTS